MTSQKTIEKCRARVKELEDINSSLVVANKTLLDNNVILAEENTKLRNELQSTKHMAAEVEEKRAQCARKCEIALKVKDAELEAARRKAANTKTLSDIVWNRDIVDGKIILTGRLP